MGLRSQNAPLMPRVAATLPLPVMGGHFEDGGGVLPLSKGNAHPNMARLSSAMLPAASEFAVQWAARPGVRETRVARAKRGWWRARLAASQ